MAREVIHISDTDAVNDFESLLAKVRTGTEIVIEHDSVPVAVVTPANGETGRTVSESIELAKAYEKQLGYAPTMTPDFAADVEEFINNNRAPFNPPEWE
jgi:antitoxin (DNA-binding transcriptional repressor) of toxin-antitoxin stability system